MSEKLQSPDMLFEVSWEVCNKVGGIHTVIATKIYVTHRQTYIQNLHDGWLESYQSLLKAARRRMGCEIGRLFNHEIHFHSRLEDCNFPEADFLQHLINFPSPSFLFPHLFQKIFPSPSLSFLPLAASVQKFEGWSTFCDAGMLKSFWKEPLTSRHRFSFPVWVRRRKKSLTTRCVTDCVSHIHAQSLCFVLS